MSIKLNNSTISELAFSQPVAAKTNGFTQNGQHYIETAYYVSDTGVNTALWTNKYTANGSPWFTVASGERSFSSGATFDISLSVCVDRPIKFTFSTRIGSAVTTTDTFYFPALDTVTAGLNTPFYALGITMYRLSATQFRFSNTAGVSYDLFSYTIAQPGEYSEITKSTSTTVAGPISPPVAGDPLPTITWSGTLSLSSSEYSGKQVVSVSARARVAGDLTRFGGQSQAQTTIAGTLLGGSVLGRTSVSASDYTYAIEKKQGGTVNWTSIKNVNAWLYVTFKIATPPPTLLLSKIIQKFNMRLFAAILLARIVARRCF